MPDAPGFSKVLIQPALGELKEVKGVMPHPAGTISVTLKRKDNTSGLSVGNSGIEGEVILPEGVGGRFVWQGKEITLTGGRQKIDL